MVSKCFMAEQDKNAYSRLGNHLRSIGLEATCVLGVGPDENPISDSKADKSKRRLTDSSRRLTAPTR